MFKIIERMGSIVGKNSINSLKPSITEVNKSAEKGIEEIKKFRESLDKNVEMFLNNITKLFEKIDDKTDNLILNVDSMILSYLAYLAVFVQIIAVFSFVSYFAAVYHKNIRHNPYSSLVSFIASMRYFASLLFIVFLLVGIYLHKNGQTINEIIEISGVIWILLIVILVVTFFKNYCCCLIGFCSLLFE